jgi:NADPH:quinone reductase-like Zn-dependent oxidoreductase
VLIRQVIDYTKHDIPAELASRYSQKPFDAIIDCVGADESIYLHCAKYLKEDGVYSSVGIKLSDFTYLASIKAVWKMQMNSIWPRSPRLLGTGRIWKATTMMDPGQELMQRAVNLIADGKLKVIIDSEWPFDQVLEAYDVVLSGRARGKVIIRMAGDSPEQSSSM